MCLFSRDQDVLANCLYITGKDDVRRCSNQQCHGKSTSERKNWRTQIKAVYHRSVRSPCFRILPCIQDMRLKKSGYRASTTSVVSTFILTFELGLQFNLYSGINSFSFTSGGHYNLTNSFSFTTGGDYNLTTYIHWTYRGGHRRSFNGGIGDRVYDL